MRCLIGEHERHQVTGIDGELRDGGHVFAAHLHRRPQHGHVGTCDGQGGGVLEAPHPWDVGAGAEANHQLHRHGHGAAVAAHKAHDIGGLATRRHEVDQGDCPLVACEVGFEDQGFAAVGSGDRSRGLLRRDQPASMIRRAEQRRKAGFGIKRRPAQPVDGALATDQRRGQAIADQGVIFDRRRQMSSRR